MQTVLVVDDEQEMRALIKLMLRQSGFQTMQAANSEEAYTILKQYEIDLVLLDVMMPNEDGFNVCKKVRTFSDVPIIFLTAKDSNEDKVHGLQLGGDDYIVKPFTSAELVARIQAVLRRVTNRVNSVARYVTKGSITLDEVSRKVYVQQKSIPLTLKEFELLHLFMKHPNLVYSREQLLEQVWSIDYAGGTRTVDTHIKTLRLKLGKDVSTSIQTVWGIGYRFEVL